MIIARGVLFALVLAAAQAKPEGSNGDPVSSPVNPDQPNSGAETPVDVNDPKIQSLAKFSLPAIEKELKASYQDYVGDNKATLNKVVKASKQVVSGEKFKISTDIYVYHDEVDNSTGKPIKDRVDSFTCNVELLEQPWVSPDPKLTALRCFWRGATTKDRL